MSGKSSYELETLFIDKLTEKYKLTERDIKRAFAQYDIDGNGMLDLREITGAIQLYLNGISKAEIQQFVRHYDTNGDGYISFEEFFSFLTKRNAIPKTTTNIRSKPAPREEIMHISAVPTADHRRRRETDNAPSGRKKRENWDFDPSSARDPRPVGVVNAWEETAYGSQGLDNDSIRRAPKTAGRPESELSGRSQFDPSDQHSVIIRSKRFVQNVRALETKRSMAVRNQDKSFDKHGAPLSEILDKISRLHIVESLERYLHIDDDARTSGVKYRDFCRYRYRQDVLVANKNYKFMSELY